MPGAITLRQFQDRYGATLRLACRVCDRKGRYRVADLIGRHGAGFGLPDFRGLVSADCPLRARHADSQACGAYFPDLIG